MKVAFGFLGFFFMFCMLGSVFYGFLHAAIVFFVLEIICVRFVVTYPKELKWIP